MALPMITIYCLPLFRSYDNFNSESYEVPWIRCQVYFMGMALGHVLHLTKNMEIKIPRPISLALWLSAFALGIACVYSVDVYEHSQNGTQPSLTARILYNSFQRLAWSAALAWLIFACFHGYGGKLSLSFSKHLCFNKE